MDNNTIQNAYKVEDIKKVINGIDNHCYFKAEGLELLQYLESAWDRASLERQIGKCELYI